MNRPRFKGRPIGSIEALARALYVSLRQLHWAIGRADALYRPMKPITKPDGSVRQTYNPAAPLKEIQRSINRNIFSRVKFPIYLQGGIRDRNNPRHCIANAKLHCGATIVFNEDIFSFFPSITRRQVQDVWQNLFRFPPEIAEALTILTTYQGILPQGAPTSSYLANLVLWRQEPELVTNLAARGIRYSRYVDDITLSSRRFICNHQKAEVIQQVRRLCNGNGFRMKGCKERIETSGKPMCVNNLQINHGVTLPKKERARIRAAVRACEVYHSESRDSSEYQKLLNSTLGRVSRLRQLHPKEGTDLMRRLTIMTEVSRSK
ncbi:MAG TPA: RNA-directed DNA polymerase [Gammaproteobacteria bacterium]|nr:RNA-directed DNA polymerase [Gammaproteobacteria bacterium]